MVIKNSTFKAFCFALIIGVCPSFSVMAQTFEADLSRAYRLLSIAQERDRVAAEKLDEVKTKRIRIEEDLLDAKENPRAMTKKQKEDLEKELKTTKSLEKNENSKRVAASLFLLEVMEIVKAPEKKRAKYLTDYEKKNGKLTPQQLDNQSVGEIAMPEKTSVESETLTRPTTPELPPAKTKKDTPPSVSKAKNKEKKTDNGKSNAQKNTPANPLREPVKYDPEKDVALNPPAPDCRIGFDGVDNFTGRRKREIETQVLFTHTEDFMKPALNGRDYITCEATAARVQGGFYFLNLTFKIMTKEAQRTFGFLDKGTPISVKLIDGATLNLVNTKTDIGVVDPNANTTTYKANFQISSSDVKTLIKTEIDVIRVSWSAGYEDYEIYDMLVLSNILRCLEKEMN